jgi:hypothetical protein
MFLFLYVELFFPIYDFLISVFFPDSLQLAISWVN